jgi:hypothetical protein
MKLVEGLTINGQIDTIFPNTNSSTIRSLYFPKIIEIMEIICLRILGNMQDSRVTLSIETSIFLHKYDCNRVTLSSSLII